MKWGVRVGQGVITVPSKMFPGHTYHLFDYGTLRLYAGQDIKETWCVMPRGFLASVGDDTQVVHWYLVNAEAVLRRMGNGYRLPDTGGPWEVIPRED